MNNTRTLFAIVIALACSLSSLSATAGSLEEVLAPLAQDKSAAPILSAIDASPALKHRLEALANSGELTAIVVVPDAQPPVVRGQAFAGATDDTIIILTAGLLTELQQNRRTDVIGKNDVLPDNTVFVLSHLAHHLEIRTRQEQFNAHLQELVHEALAKADQSGAEFDQQPLIEFATQGNLQLEAECMISGWNAVVNAAVHTAGKDNTTDEAEVAVMLAPLLINLRYREVFTKAMELPKDQRIQLMANGIPMDQRNIDAIIAALMQMQLLDIQ